MDAACHLADDGAWEVAARGRAILSDPRLNRGTAFTEEERRALGLVGLLPPGVLPLEQQVERAWEQLLRQPTDLAKHVALTHLQDRNEVLFHRVLCEHLAELLPIVYTPTVGEAIRRYSQEYRRPRGAYLSIEHPEQIDEALANTGLGPGDVDVVVATDAGAILGIGDWGVGGIGIAVGKLTVYTAAAGLDPGRGLPVILDVGTENQQLLDDPLYLGNRRRRATGAEYDRFVDAFVEACTRRFPDALLHWEDLGLGDARRVLDRTKDRCCSFNDDIQGTGAVNLAAVLGGVRVTGVPLREHRVVVFGAGTAGLGNADQLADAMAAAGVGDDARRSIWCVDRHGLVVDDLPDLLPRQRHYARPRAEVEGWRRDLPTDAVPGGGIDLLEVVRRVRPTVLIGTSTRPGAFTEDVVRAMAAGCERPVVLPMSNPTPLAEAVPTDLLRWTDGRALVATGSPFPPVTLGRTTYDIGQANNALVFPGLGLGVAVARAARVTDGMLQAAAKAVAAQVDPTRPGAPLLPGIDRLRPTSLAVAVAVVRAAAEDGVARADVAGLDDAHLAARVEARTWEATYRPIRAV